MTRHRRLLATLLGSGLLVIAFAGPASAHPLGNFTINHYDGLTLRADGVDDTAVIDTAEIPTSQRRPRIDTNHDGSVSSVERAAHARRSCATLAGALHLTVDGRRLPLGTTRSSFTYRTGAAGLSTSRLVCRLHVDADLHRSAIVAFADGYEADRIGWREVTALGDGVHLDHSPVPASSVSDKLLRYPNNLLSSPLDVRAATVHTLPGPGVSTFATGLAAVPGAGFLARALDRLNSVFDGLVGAKHAGLGVSLLAVLLAVVLGASHAALPGHGKTVMAAYIAGRRGRIRDAVTVGATVTLTHTAGVLALGLALTLSASIAGDVVLRDLGVVSGLLIAVVGVGLLRSAVRERPHRLHAFDDQIEAVAPVHDQVHEPVPEPVRELVTVGAPASAPAPVAGHHHHDGHEHDHHHAHGRGHDHGHHHGRPLSRGGLIGMGVAGGLVPSPSALVVLLGAIALGRTVFGVVLVLGYGVGMAATLIAAGLLLVKMRNRFDRPGMRVRLRWATRLSALMPVLTATLVVVVGLALAGRGVVPSV
jgi:ABC-type nickel/cobalt efflux system permease component RcnA